MRHQSRQASGLTCWAALVESFRNSSVAQGETVIQPEGVLDDCHPESVARGLDVGHGESAYPDLMTATQSYGVMPWSGLAGHE